MFSFTLHVNKGLVSEDDFFQFWCLCFVFFRFFLRNNYTPLHFIHYKIKQSCCFTVEILLYLCDWWSCLTRVWVVFKGTLLLKEIWLWRKELSVTGFFFLWNRKSKSSSVEYLWFVFVCFTKLKKNCHVVPAPAPYLIYFMCWFFSKFLIIVVRCFLMVLMTAMWSDPHTLHLVMMVVETVQWFLCYKYHVYFCEHLICWDLGRSCNHNIKP